MKQPRLLTRRLFVRNGIFSTTLVTSIGPAPLLLGASSKTDEPDHGLKLGLTTYTLRKFNLDQALAMTRDANLRYISLKDMHLPLKSSRDQRMEAREKVKAAGLVLMGGGVIYMKNDEQEIRSAFEYAKDASMPTIICSPEIPALDTVEKFAKQFQIRIAIHNHGPGDKNYPSPLDIFRLVKDRHSLMGICMDVGHTVRNGENPVSVIEQCGSRLYDFHMKDVTKAADSGGSVEVGKGVIDIPGVLRALLNLKFKYHVALEYEANANDPMPGIKDSIQYIRRVLKEI
jgi:sugar phosphate isomerase/epimerase